MYGLSDVITPMVIRVAATLWRGAESVEDDGGGPGCAARFVWTLRQRVVPLGKGGGQGLSSERPSDSHTCDQADARSAEAGVETVHWDSVAARESVQRICQEAALRCQRVIARYASVDVPHEDGRDRCLPDSQDRRE